MQWISIIQMNCPSWMPTKYPRFCSLHFDKNDIIGGKNNKLQYSAVPLYFNENIRDEKEVATKTRTGPSTKISTLIADIQQHQLLYSSESEAEYQVTVKVIKKPRNGGKTDTNATQSVLRCDFCHKNKQNAVEMQAHLRTIHNVIVDIVTPKTASSQIKEDDLTKNHMCSICGLVFRSDPAMALDHMQNGHKMVMKEELQLVEEVDDLQESEHTQYVVEELQEDMIYESPTENHKNEEHDENMVTYIETTDLELPEETESPPLVTNIQNEEDLIEENVQTTYKCRLCSIDFMDREDVKAHIIETHTISNPEEESSAEEKEAYEPICYLCKMSFVSLAKMRKHIKRTHKCDECYYCPHCTGTFLSLDMYEDHECLEQMLV